MNYRKQDIKLIVDGLNKLSLAVQKMMLDNVDSQQPSFKVLDTRARSKARKTGSFSAIDIQARVLNGVWLLSAKREMRNGEFQAFRKARGFNPRTGEYMMRVAKRFLREIATPSPRMGNFQAWTQQRDVREAVETFVGNKSWNDLIGRSFCETRRRRAEAAIVK